MELVTGGAGFIGSHVVRELLDAGVTVRAPVRNPENAEFLKELPGSEHLEIVQMDLMKQETVNAAVKDCDDVIHCAASLYVGAKDVKKEVVDPSVIGVKNLCSVMGNVKRVIHTSSVAAIRSTKFENGKIFTSSDGSS